MIIMLVAMHLLMIMTALEREDPLEVQLPFGEKICQPHKSQVIVVQSLV